MKLSTTAQATLISNLWDSQEQQDLSACSKERQAQVLAEFTQDATAMRGWIEDLRNDAELSKDDLPELAKAYTDTAYELESLIKTYELTVFCANGDESDSTKVEAVSWEDANTKAKRILDQQGLKMKFKVKLIPTKQTNS